MIGNSNDQSTQQLSRVSCSEVSNHVHAGACSEVSNHVHAEPCSEVSNHVHAEPCNEVSNHVHAEPCSDMPHINYQGFHAVPSVITCMQSLR